MFIHSSRAAAARWRWLWCSGHRGWGRNIAVHVRHLLLGLRLLRLLLLWRQEHRTGRQLCPRRHHDDHHLSHGRRCHARRCNAVLRHHAVVRHRVRHHWWLLLRLLWWHCVVSHRLWLWSRHIPPLLLLLLGTTSLVTLQLFLEFFRSHPCTLCKTSVKGEKKR